VSIAAAASAKPAIKPQKVIAPLGRPKCGSTFLPCK
jgi:hypothetical protein